MALLLVRKQADFFLYFFTLNFFSTWKAVVLDKKKTLNNSAIKRRQSLSQYLEGHRCYGCKDYLIWTVITEELTEELYRGLNENKL